MNANHYQDMILKRSNSQELMLCVNNKPVMFPVRMPSQGEHVIIDYINFVVDIYDITTKHDRNTPDYIGELIQLDMNNELNDDERIVYIDYVAHEQRNLCKRYVHHHLIRYSYLAESARQYNRVYFGRV